MCQGYRCSVCVSGWCVCVCVVWHNLSLLTAALLLEVWTSSMIMVADNHLSSAASNYKTSGDGQSRVTVKVFNALLCLHAIPVFLPSMLVWIKLEAVKGRQVCLTRFQSSTCRLTVRSFTPGPHLWPTQRTKVNRVNSAIVITSWAIESDLQQAAYVSCN